MSDNRSMVVSALNSLHVDDTITQSAWILDSGATHHMTFHSELFRTYTSSSSIPYITVADGSHTRVDGCGDIDLQFFKLKDVLHVPNLSNNLISIRKLTQDNNCTVMFFHSHCVFQDLTTGKTIGVAKEQGGLYYLSDERTGQKVLSPHSGLNQSLILLPHKSGFSTSVLVILHFL